MSKEEKVISEVLKNGNNLTLSLLRILNKRGWKTSLSPRYIDNEKAIIREIDLVASRSISIDNAPELIFSLVIEAKYTDDKPWAFYFGQNEKAVDQFDAINRVHYMKPPGWDGKFMESLLDDLIFVMGQTTMRYDVSEIGILPATNLMENHEQPSSFFKASNSVIKTILFEQQKSIKRAFHSLTIFYPIIVSRGDIFKIDSSAENNEDSIRGSLAKFDSPQIVRVNHLGKINFDEPTEYWDSNDYFFSVMEEKQFQGFLDSLEPEIDSISSRLEMKKQYFANRESELINRVDN